MVSPFNPVQSSACENTCNIPYMSPNAALYVDAFYGPLGIPGGVLGKIKLQVCCTATCQESKDIGDVPLVFLLHIFGGTRLLHSALVQVLASSGFADITVAHTFKSFVVEFPYGSVIPSLNDSSWDLAIPGRLGPLQDIRVDDQLVPGSPCMFSAERAAVLGHSFGGSTSIALLMKDSRFVGGLNSYGEQFGEITDMQQPAVLFGTTGATPSPHTSILDPSWAETLRHLKRWNRRVWLHNITHSGFIDVSILYKTGVLSRWAMKAVVM
ncbi:hypothetical protein BKA66DRAFT_533359 [Pyrenochaeta sp. MPI-SDFR-AT-0127]|nr:hypothetical protein BKA66DRAFT_533359 [Pyrenochaeta sp. MPI-SDFR-AT-0127]